MYVLASGSPRRRELMKLVVPEFECAVSGCDEFVPKGTAPEKIPELLARQKAQAVASYSYLLHYCTHKGAYLSNVSAINLSNKWDKKIYDAVDRKSVV